MNLYQFYMGQDIIIGVGNDTDGEFYFFGEVYTNGVVTFKKYYY